MHLNNKKIKTYITQLHISEINMQNTKHKKKDISDPNRGKIRGHPVYSIQKERFIISQGGCLSGGGLTGDFCILSLTLIG